MTRTVQHVRHGHTWELVYEADKSKAYQPFRITRTDSAGVPKQIIDGSTVEDLVKLAIEHRRRCLPVMSQIDALRGGPASLNLVPSPFGYTFCGKDIQAVWSYSDRSFRIEVQPFPDRMGQNITLYHDLLQSFVNDYLTQHEITA